MGKVWPPLRRGRTEDFSHTLSFGLCVVFYHSERFCILFSIVRSPFIMFSRTKRERYGA